MENKFDKNYIIGLLLMFLMFAAYTMFFSPEPITPAEQPATEAKIEESSASITTEEVKVAEIPLNPLLDSTQVLAEEKEIEIDNKDLRVVFSSKGAKIKKVALKNYKSYRDFNEGIENEMVLYDGLNEGFNLILPGKQGDLSLNDIYFSTDGVQLVSGGEGGHTISFTANVGGGLIEKTYTLPSEGFEIKESVNNQNLENALNKKPLLYSWENEVQVLENDIKENRRTTQINYFDNDKDFYSLGFNSFSDDKKDAKRDIKWFSFYQRYFTTGVVAEDFYFNNAKFTLNVPTEDTTVVKVGKASMEIPFDEFIGKNSNYIYYFGPNELPDLKAVGYDFQKNLYLGYDIVKPINRYIFVPLFSWVESFVSNYGLLIVIVVLIIKLALTPLIYKSYMSSAKMRVLAPEINAIKEKVGGDAVKVQQETMKLYQQVGVNPLSGCIPMLLQMPILMSVFFLFPNLIMFRQKGFLWSNDLSTYDSVLNWSFNVPLIGNHLSLFVILMTLSTLAFTYYNNQITPDQPGPVDMKKISYIFPLVFLFVLNSYPAALSFYYLVSNLVTIAQQQVVKRFVNEDRIMAILEENRRNYQNRPQKKNKFSDFIEKQMQASEEMKRQNEELKNKRKKKN